MRAGSPAAGSEAGAAVRVRFAPSPTGGLHIGSARTALYNFLFARHHGGTFILRIEDTDVERSQDHFESSIMDDLRWLGLEWDEGPDRGGCSPPYRQSERQDRYRDLARGLLDRGEAYHCFCSEERLAALREEQMAAGRAPRYDGRCATLDPAESRRRVQAGEAAAVRLRVPRRAVVVDDVLRGPVEFGADAFGDFIIVRSSGLAGYNFAAVADDRDMAITHVIRGDDHLTNTGRQLHIFAALGAAPPRYCHHSMVLGKDGGKLSKRHGATTIGEFSDLGFLPAAIANYLALLSWSHGGDEVLEMDRLIAAFELERLATSPAVFDTDKLEWLNHRHIMELADDRHERLVAQRLPADTPREAVAAIAQALKPSLERYGQVPAEAAVILERPAPEPEAARAMTASAPQLAAFVRLRRDAAEWLAPSEARALLTAYRAAAKEMGVGARQALMPLRLALTGREHGPELPFVLAALSREETLTRLSAAGVTAG